MVQEKDSVNGTRIYLGCPYTGNGDKIKQRRFDQVTRAAGLLMKMNMLVISPITHGHPIAMSVGVPGTWAYWERVCKWMIGYSDLFIVLKLEGWEGSIGIANEKRIAREMGIPIVSMTAEEVEKLWQDFCLNGSIDEICGQKVNG